MQKLVEGQLTLSRIFEPSMFVAADQLVPLKVKTLPLLSTAAQNDDETHETESSAFPVPGSTSNVDQPGGVQNVPEQSNAYPPASTAMQNGVEVTHDTEVKS